MGKRLQNRCIRPYSTQSVIFKKFRKCRFFLTKLGTFGKMAPNFVTLGNYNNDHATNLKFCI